SKVGGQHIARHFNFNITTIYRLQRRYNTTQSTDDLPRSGRPRVTTPRQDRHITRQDLRDPFLPASQTARATVGRHNQPISRDTVIRRLHSANLRCCRPARHPVLRPRHRQARLQWAQGHRNWRHFRLHKCQTDATGQASSVSSTNGEKIQMNRSRPQEITCKASEWHPT
uniref:Transposase Tc1-like domain-containing protein n=1 Tax=Acanthochromis polyacanthus TaxID=80966 RepID=A0A3Q1HYK3_9TELE